MSLPASSGELGLHPDVHETLDSIKTALEEARTAPQEPTLVDAAYHRELDLLLLRLSDNRRLAIPREDIQVLANATPDQIADFRIDPPFVDIWWPQLDEGLYLPNRLDGRYGSAA